VRAIMPSRLRALLPVLAMGVALAAPASAQNLYEHFWVPDGPVFAVQPYFDRMIFGGSFQRVGPPTGSAAVTDPASGLLAGPPLGVDGIVGAVVSDGAGGWYLGGTFTTIRGVARSRLAHIDATGAVTAWAPEPDGEIRALLLIDQTLYVGGDFTTIAGVARTRLAALDRTTGVAAAWNPGANAMVRFIGEFSSVIYAGGEFTQIGVTTRNRAAAIHPTTGALQSWNPNVNGPVNAMFRSGTNIAIGGLFSTVGGQPRVNLAVVNTAGTVAPLATHADGEVHAFTTASGDVYVVGDFTSVAGVPRQRLAAFDPAINALRPWNPGADGRVRTIVFGDNQLWIGGDFANAGGQPRNRAAALSPADDVANAWNPNAAGSVHAVGIDASQAFVGGQFFSVNWVARQNIAAIVTDPTSANFGKAHAFSPNVGGGIRSLALSPYLDILIGGATSLNGQPRSSFAMVSAVDGTPSPYAPVFDGVPMEIEAASYGSIWLGGHFTSIDGVSSRGMSVIDIGAGVQSTFQSPPNSGLVLAIDEVDIDHTYVGGIFDELRGAARKGLGQVDFFTGLVTPWNPMRPDSAIHGTVAIFAIEAGNVLVYAAGSFAFGASARTHLLAFDAVTGAAEPWAPNPDNIVLAMTRRNGRLYIGGHFLNVEGLPRAHLAGFEASTQGHGGQSLLTWAPAISGLPYAISAQSNAGFPGAQVVVAVGGDYQRVNGFHHPFLAFLDDQSLAGVDVGETPAPSPRLVFEPNPVRASSRVRFTLERPGRVTLRIFDLQGREVARPLAGAWLEAGPQVARLDASPLAPGLYAYRLDVGGTLTAGKLVVVR
jgi:hypothetical protein